MAEVYTFTNVDDTTPVEVTGGRVGSFKLYATNQNLRVGDSAVTNSTGLTLVGGGLTYHDFYVTSPDEIYVVGVTGVTDVVVFHNR